MHENWAVEHLQVIRTLMERSAVYRRALAPLMTLAGVAGSVAAVIGWQQRIDSPRPFVLYWTAVSLVVLTGAFVLVRRQALRAGEVLWSPPTRRVSAALLPGFAAGAFAGAAAWIANDALLLLPAMWVGIYGCALHAAGFFMPRGIRLFGWCFLLVGGLTLLGTLSGQIRCPPHLLMGLFFGVLHLAYGVYLYFTEQRKTLA